MVLLTAVASLKSSKSKAEETKRAEHERDKRTLAAEEDRARQRASGTAGNARAAPAQAADPAPSRGWQDSLPDYRAERRRRRGGSREEELARPRVLRGLAGMARRERRAIILSRLSG